MTEQTTVTYVTCIRCHGSGYMTELQSYGAFNGFVNKRCDNCRGTGKVGRH